MTKTLLLALTLLAPLASWAQDNRPVDIKVGLWESTVATEIAGMPAMPAMPALSEEQLAQMPPAARAQIEARMKAAGGGSPRTTTAKYCVTREALSRGLAMGGTDAKNCTQKLVSTSTEKQQIHVECTQGNTKTSGDITFERVDAEHVKALALIKGTGDSSTGGRTIDIKATITSKWMAADCGSVKPAGEN